MSRQKQLPVCNKSEKALLGTILLEPQKLHGITTHEREFYVKKHQELFRLIKEHDSKHMSWDTITLSEFLLKEKREKLIGGLDYLLELQDYAIVGSHSQYYAKEIRRVYELREEIKLYEDSLYRLYDKQESEADNVIAKLIGKPQEIELNTDKIVEDWKEAQKGNRRCIPTPYESLDRQTGGIKQGMVTIFTGRSKSGKSMFLSHWYNFLGRNGYPILVVPLEDKYDVTIKRMAGNLGAIHIGELDAGGRYMKRNGAWEYIHTTDKQIEQATDLLEQVSKYPIEFFDRKCTPNQLRGIAIRYKRKYNIQAMFVDGAKDLLRPSGKYNDTGFDEEISQQLCRIAEELNIAVIAVHHLTKIHEDERISVNHIRGSGNIVGDSRAVYALQSSGIERLLQEKGYVPKYDEDGKLQTRILECLVNNHGGTGMKALDIDLNRCQFYESRK